MLWLLISLSDCHACFVTTDGGKGGLDMSLTLSGVPLTSANYRMQESKLITAHVCINFVSLIFGMIIRFAKH